jgi:hypothetical protein
MVSALIETWSYPRARPNVGVVPHLDAGHVRPSICLVWSMPAIGQTEKAGE